MGGMPIDDHNPRFGLRDDIVLMDLRAGGPQRQVVLFVHRGGFDTCRWGLGESRCLRLERHGAYRE